MRAATGASVAGRDPPPPPSPDLSRLLQVLRSAFPGVRIHDDVTSLERLPEVGAPGLPWCPWAAPLCCRPMVFMGFQLQETELLVAGFPCVDVSRAGLRRGLEGQSTGLVRHVFRLLQVGPPSAAASPPPSLALCAADDALPARCIAHPKNAPPFLSRSKPRMTGARCPGCCWRMWV